MDDENYECEFCDKRFSSESNVRRHIKNVHYKKDLKCPKCEFKTSRKDNLDRHMFVKHKNESFLFECKTCGQKMARKDNLKDHTSKCNGKKKFISDRCKI